MLKRFILDRLFMLLCLTSILVIAGFLLFLLTPIITSSIESFKRTEIHAIFTFDANHRPILKLAAAEGVAIGNTTLPPRLDYAMIIDQFSTELDLPIGDGAIYKLAEIAANKETNLWLPVGYEIDSFVRFKEPGSLTTKQQILIKKLVSQELIKIKLSADFFRHHDSREADIAGIAGGLVGSFFSIIVCLIFALPIALFSAIYFVEFAPKNKFTDLVMVNINNLASVPSIVFGLVGLSIFIGYFGMPRSSPLVAGLVLSLMIIPIIFITTMNALKTVPQNIRQGIMALGASKMQMLFHHVLPASLPNILTGVILAISRAFGETAPLLMIGMVAFITSTPHSVLEPATTIPVQIYLWFDSPEKLFHAKAASAIVFLLLLLVLLNILSCIIRSKYEKKW
jgi:phosphate transport system permease protein